MDVGLKLGLSVIDTQVSQDVRLASGPVGIVARNQIVTRAQAFGVRIAACFRLRTSVVLHILRGPI